MPSPPPTPTTASSSYLSSPDRVHRLWQQTEYPKEVWWLVSAVIGVLALIHFSTSVLDWIHIRRLSQSKNTAVLVEKQGAEPVLAAQSGKIALRRLPLSVVSALRIIAFRWSPPFAAFHHLCVSEMTFVVGYTAALLTWCFVDSPDLNPQWWANRAGQLATSQIPLIVGLAGKNNVISFLTGVGPEKLNVLHRASARATLVLVWVHAFSWWKLGLEHFLQESWLHWGMTGMAAFTLATLLSFRPVRNLAYEVFLISHIILVFLFMLAACLHWPKLNYRVWPGFLLWGLDRFCRLIHLVVLNRLWLSVLPKKKSDASNVKLEQLSDDTLLLTLYRRASWKAGQHFYLMLPSISSIPFESHPFTAASIPYAFEGASEAARIRSGVGNREHELVFIIRARDGFTRRLLQHATMEGASSVPLCAYVDGPYGCPPSLALYDMCILIAGGSGVTYTLSLLLDLVRRAQEGITSVREIVFIWAIKDAAHTDWILDTLNTAIAHAPSSLKIDIRIFVTATKKEDAYDIPSFPYSAHTPESPDKRSGAPSPTASTDEISSPLPARLGTGKVKLVLGRGRPDLEQILKEQITSADGSVSVSVSGPASLASSVRSALSHDLAGPAAVLQGGATVTLHVESFGW
ncbi:hypothetical protein BOTBODRAFT_170807 [Botryobasidium botryosum FD-172 SS1]|uniref:FAD-binding FR-type domain-containing protein n=1 Tax=Botryobasidium botryosum (strain FD-172 SS1) TaxID=930990 RepID=A0A067MVT1_BOTB1|nr:hypothetical protein BOTBODRAFT_170807 [Botryobasidium botryosum FD-172 SS1]